MFEILTQQISDLIIPYAHHLDVEIIELNIKRRGKSILVEVLADKDHGGITIDECSSINRFLSNKLEEEALIEGDYMVDVSSPGLDRPLRTPKDFLRIKDLEVKFYLSQPVENKREYAGVVKEVLENGVTIRLGSNTLTIPWNSIQKAIQVF